jgi:hypothetical protein
VCAGCRNNGSQNDPFSQRRIIAPPPAANYAPPTVQMPAAPGVPALQPVPGPQAGTAAGSTQWATTTNAADGSKIIPASATSNSTSASSSGANDQWKAAEKSSAVPPDHSAMHPAEAEQPSQPGVEPQILAAKSLDWSAPKSP